MAHPIMASPSMVTRNGDSLIVRSVVSGDTLYGTELPKDVVGDDAGDTGEEDFLRDDFDDTDSEPDNDLPQCKVKRNYSCSQCEYYTQNPRFYLYHQKQVHNQKIKIYECASCLYASKHSQKLQRHIHMVHVMGKKKDKPQLPSKPKKEPKLVPETTPSGVYQMEGEEDEPEPIFKDENGDQIFKCTICAFSSKNREKVQRHERLIHLKKKFWRCAKCNYVTHMKARYTKHVKYHSMPMIKCDLCDFRTPYKWNLDRHNKNHTGDGPFKCSICNFTAEIKQSLTVHEMNHHVPPVGHLVITSNNRRRLKVGASDTMGMVTEEDQIEQSELELLRIEREGASFDQNPADFVQAQLDIPTDSSSAAENPDQPAKPQLIQISKYSCKACDFKGNLGEVQRHEQDKHRITGIFLDAGGAAEMALGDKSGNASDRSTDSPVLEKKKRPIPNLIPIQSQKRPELTKENVSHFERNFKDLEFLVNNELRKSQSPDLGDTDKKIDSFKKKNASFFDKLKEKLMTSANMEGMLMCTFCGHESKCLSEHMKHQKSHIPGERDDHSESSFGSQGFPSVEPSSTRCQHCRHRCKSSSDLMAHLQTCTEAPAPKPLEDIKSEPEDNPENPHPMENKVFVWNTLTENSNLPEEPYPSVKSPKLSEEKAFVGIEVKPGYGTTTNDGQEETITSKDVNTKKVFKCPHCTFWASTASRFHVHIVGHLNKRPFQCSLCHYSSNWRWDITKHIRLKTIRDPTHEKAKVLLTDETGRRNYSKYNKYLTTMKMESQHVQHSQQQQQNSQQPQTAPNNNKIHRKILPKDGQAGTKRPAGSSDECDSPKKKPHVENKKTMWKCKKCHFRNTDREVVLEHVRDHYRNAADSAKKKKKLLGKPDANKEEEESSGETDNQREEVTCPEFMCETCPFTCTSWPELEGHSEKHFVCTVNGKQFKCTYCSFYAQDNEELGLHLATHAEANAKNDADFRTGAHACIQCPYVAINRIQLIYHQRRHGQTDAQCSHKCYKCCYGAPNNTILALHVRLHGRHNTTEPSESRSPAKLPADISKVDTSRFPDIPMVWVSKPMGISKMFKCRFCPHINMRRSNIQEHEKMHRGPASPSLGPQHKCPDCDYICNNAGVLSAHFKVHQGLFGQIVGVVDCTKPDDEQIAEMKDRLTQHELPCPSSSLSLNADPNDQADDRVLRFCGLCPARFLFSKEMKIHTRFHELKLLYKCDSCSYTARQKQHLEAHFKVHTDEYQDRTNVLTSVYDTDVENPRPKTAAVFAKDSKDSIWVVVKDEPDSDGVEFEQQSDSPNKNGTKQYSCTKCPAEFFKSVALSYHETLHGGKGQHKCKSCDYAVKTYGNLIRHEAVHKSPKSPEKVPNLELLKQKSETSKCPKSPPAAQLPMDPEFGILIHGSPEFIYPTYLKNGKTKEKRYKCHKCPSAFDKREQYKVHLSLHGSRQRYSCKRCDYSVKYYANYTQHMKKHELNDASHKERKSVFSDDNNEEMEVDDDSNGTKNVDRCSKTMKLSTADEQALMLMQQRNYASGTVPDKDAISRCPHCPYTNNRKDGVSSHVRCHSNPRGGPYMCKYCDYTVSQFNFLRDHTKIHFNTPKFVKPDAYMKVEHMEIWAEPAEDAEGEKFLVFKDQGAKAKRNRFLPTRADPVPTKSRVFINLRTGEEEVEVDEDANKRSKPNVDYDEEYTQPDDDPDRLALQPDSKSEESSKYSSCSDSE